MDQISENSRSNIIVGGIPQLSWSISSCCQQYFLGWMIIDGSDWIHVGCPFACLHQFLIFKFVPGNCSSACTYKNAIINLLKVCTNGFAFGVLIILSYKRRTDLCKIFRIKGKKLWSQGRNKEELLVSWPSDIVCYQRRNTETSQRFFSLCKIPDEELSLFATSSDEFSSFIEFNTIDLVFVSINSNARLRTFVFPDQYGLIRTSRCKSASIMIVIKGPNPFPK